MIKIKLLLLLLLANNPVFSQTYRHVGNNPFQVILPSGFYYGSNEFATLTPHYNAIGSKSAKLGDYTSSFVDSVKFRDLCYSRDKILKNEKIKVNDLDAVYIETKSRFDTYGFYVFIIHENQIHYLDANATDEEYVEVLRKTVRESKFLPAEKPDALKDSEIKFDVSMLKDFTDESGKDYPNFKFTDMKKYNFLSLKITYKKFQPEDRKGIAKMMTSASLSDSLKTEVKDIELMDIPGKEVIHTGLGYSGGKALNYRVILFDPNGNFFLTLTYDSFDDAGKNLEFIQKFIQTLQPKRAKLSKENIAGNWKITKIEEAGEEAVCSEKITGKTIRISETEISYTLCEDEKTADKKLKYEVKDGVLEIFDRIKFAGEMSDVTYTNKGYVSDNTAVVYFWKIGLVTMEKIK